MKTKGKLNDWLQDFQASTKRPFKLRMDYSFIHTFKPVLDEAAYRSFNSMKAYRQWCEKNLPSWLGYGKSL